MKRSICILYCFCLAFFCIGQNIDCRLNKIIIYRFEEGKTDAIDKIEITFDNIIYKNALSNQVNEIVDTTNLRNYFLCKDTEFYKNLATENIVSSRKFIHSYSIMVFVDDTKDTYYIMKVPDLEHEKKLTIYAEHIDVINKIFPYIGGNFPKSVPNRRIDIEKFIKENSR